MNITTKITKCLCCGGNVSLVHDFGSTPLANTYGVTDKFPLIVNVCEDCFHLQLGESVDPSILYSDYVYCSGTSGAAIRFFDDFAIFTAAHCPSAKTVLDIACNDGTQLDAFKKLGLETFGCDPAENISVSTKDKGHKVFVGIFEDMRIDRTYDIITAQNVIGHSANPVRFMANAARAMHEESKLLIMTSQAEMIPRRECDTVYHEHISYFNVLSMMRLLARAGLVLLDIQMSPFHGTSYVFIAGKKGIPKSNVWGRIGIEEGNGVYTRSTYALWAGECMKKIARFKQKLQQHRDRKMPIHGLCAAAKGISMLNMAGEKLDYIFDSTPLKHWKRASGMTIRPFEDVQKIDDDPAAFVVLAWNFYDEVKKNFKALRDIGQDKLFTPYSCVKS